MSLTIEGCMRLVKFLAVVLVFMAGTRFSHGQSTLITFDGQATNTAVSVQSYSEGGILFSPIGSMTPGNTFTRVGSMGPLAQAENGTAYVRAGQGQSLSFSFTNGSVFSLNSVDLAEYSTVVGGTATVHFVGYFANGSTIVQDLTTDGIIDGTGPITDFQTFTFRGWDNLTRVEIPTYGWSLDNLVVTPLPEPGTIGLGVLGVAALYLARRKPRQN